MTKEEFAKGIAFLSAVYTKALTPEQVAVWYTFFKDDKIEEFQTAVKKISVKSKYWPSIAEIKDVMAEDAVGIIPADQAWNKVLDAIRKHGWCNAEAAMQSLPAAARLTVNHMGGFARLCESEDIEWTRKDFIKAYEINKNREQMDYATGTLITIADVAAKKKLLEEKDGRC